MDQCSFEINGIKYSSKEAKIVKNKLIARDVTLQINDKNYKRVTFVQKLD